MLFGISNRYWCRVGTTAQGLLFYEKARAQQCDDDDDDHDGDDDDDWIKVSIVLNIY